MQSVIYKIFSKKIDEEVHSEFIKYSEGIFENKYLLEAKKQKEGWAIKTSAEFVNYLVKSCLEKTKGEIEVSGVIVSTFDLRNAMGGYVFDPEEKVKQFMGIKQLVVDTKPSPGMVNSIQKFKDGIKQLVVDTKTSPERIIELMNKFPRAFYALTFSTPDFQIKTKAKAPKGAKPAAAGEKEVAPNFCSIKTSNNEIVQDLFFDALDFKEIKINHTIQINEIILPKEIGDPAQMREKAIRKGKIIRKLTIDGNKKEKEIDFEA